MKTSLRWILVAGLLACLPALSPAEAPPATSDKAKSIFDGKTLDGWESPDKNLWNVKDGCLTGGDGKTKVPYNDFLCTKASYANFILHLKIKLTGDPKTGFINSGIQIRTRRNPTGHEVCGYQCDYGDPSWYACIYDEGRRDRVMMPADPAVRAAIHLWDWNDYVIFADGKRIKTWINGVQGVDYVEQDPDIAEEGIIGIQIHGGGNAIVQVKDVFIEELPPTPGAITWEQLGGVEGQRAKLKPAPGAAAKVPAATFTKRQGPIDPTPKAPAWDGNGNVFIVDGDQITAGVSSRSAAVESLLSKQITQDFELTFDYRIVGSGLKPAILFRAQHAGQANAIGYEAVLDDGAQEAGRLIESHGRNLLADRGTHVSIAPDGRHWTDPIDGAPNYAGAVKAGEWNSARIRATASHIELWINGILFCSLDDNAANIARFDGILGLEVRRGPGSGKVELRKLRFADLGGTEPAAYEAKVAAAAAAVQLDVPSIIPLGADGKSLNLDFETGTLQGWKAEGNAWEGQPIKGDTVAPRKAGERSNHAGQYWIGGFEVAGDKGTGTLTSSTFEVTHPFASFLVGGGHDHSTRVEVVEAATGKVIFTANGRDMEEMHREVVDLHAYAGKQIFVRLVDTATGGWGHVNFDDFVFHDKAPSVAAIASVNGNNNASRQKESPVLWHLQPNPAKPTAVANAVAQKVVAGMMLTKGFQAELIAAEPEVKQPIAFAIDERGRIWVAEAYCYPQKQPEGQGKDRILILEDVDGDGTFKKRTVFIEGLNLVSGMEVGFNGVWVGAAPELLFIPKDKDDKPGKPEVLLDGFGYQDTHETLNSFCWGPDGWLYGNQGVFTTSNIGKPGTPNEQRIHLNSGVWRYHPIRHEFEIFAHGGSNQWGLDFNEAGDMFMTHCRSFWGGGGTTFVIRNGHFWNQANGGYAPFISNAAPDFAPDLKNFLPASARYDDGEGGAGKPGTTAVFGGHAHAGTMVYLGDNWPDIYRDHLFTNNLFGRQMNHEENVRVGSAYETFHAGYDLMYTPDETFMGVNLKTGPDGAVYQIDWCDLQHCHTPMVEKIDRTNGRIYRISWAATYHPVKVDLGKMSDAELVALQTHRNDWYSRMARKILQERAATGKIDPAAIHALKQMATTASNYAHVLRALWTLRVIGALDEPTLETALHHSDDRVRGWAIRLATDGGPTLPGQTLVALATSDPSAAVRLALASAMPTLAPDACWNVGVALAAHGEDANDRFLPKMIWYGLARVVANDLPRGLELAGKTPMPSLADSIHWYAATQAPGRELLASHIAGDPQATAERELRILAFGLRNDATAAMPKAWPAARDRFAGSQSAITNELSALFGDKDIIAKTRATLADDKAPMPDRRAAFALLKRIGDRESAPVYARLLDIREFASEVIPLLSGSDDPAVATALIERYPKLDGKDRVAALGALTSKAVLAKTLLAAVKDGKFERKALSSFQVRQMRNLHDATVDQALDQSWGKVTESSASMKATMAKLQKAYQEAPLWAYDANAGHKVFQQTCAICHTINGEGGKLGPDLTGSGRNGVPYFLENIVDPNAVVGDQYQMTIITKKDGTVLTGISNEESATAVTLRTVTEVLVVPKSEIKDRQKKAESMMPAGLLEALPERNVIELLKFLTSSK